MTFDEPLISRCPWISAPHTPTMVLFDPTRTLPADRAPLTTTTAASVPPTAVANAASVVTIVDAALPPPMVPPDIAAQPTTASAGGIAHAPEPPEPFAPPE